MPDHLYEPFADFQSDISDEPVAHDHVDFSAVNVAALDVPDEVQIEELHHRGGGARDFVPFMVLLADREDPDAGLRPSENDPGIDFAHDGELREHAGRAIDIGADVHH